MQIFVQFTDATESAISAVFGCAQDPTAYPNQANISSNDPRYIAFIDPSSTLSGAQAVQLAVMDSAYVAASTAPIAYMATAFQADQASQNLITSVMTASGGSLPVGFEWYDEDNNGVVMTYAQLQGLAGAILSRGQPLFAHKQIQKSAIRAATTVAEVEAITW